MAILARLNTKSISSYRKCQPVSDLKHFSHHGFEVDSFVSKFKHLWNSGIDATLTVKSKNGKATVVLTADLGPLPGPPCQVYLPRHPLRQDRSPAYQRRQERRQAAGKAAAKVDHVAEEADDRIAVKADEVPEALAVDAELGADEATQEVCDQTVKKHRVDFPLRKLLFAKAI